MKRFTMLAALVGGVMFAGSASTARADHLGGWGGGWASDHDCHHHQGGGFVGLNNGFVGNGYYNGYNNYGYSGIQTYPNYGSTVYFGSPRFSIGFSSGNYGYVRPYRGHGYGHRGYGW